MVLSIYLSTCCLADHFGYFTGQQPILKLKVDFWDQLDLVYLLMHDIGSPGIHSMSPRFHSKILHVRKHESLFLIPRELKKETKSEN